MYQQVIRDPGGGDLIRIQPVLCDLRHAVVNGSLLVVPPGTTAFAAVNGIMSEPYGPGTYKLFTGENPFFVRLRHIMTHGDAGVTVTVYFVSIYKAKFLTFGTGDVPFKANDFDLTMNARASCSLTYAIADPRTVLEKLIGSYRSAFCEDDLDPCFIQLMQRPVRETLAHVLQHYGITEMNQQLRQISADALVSLRTALAAYGIRAERFEVIGIHIPPEELQRLHKAEDLRAEGHLRTDIELDHLKRVWNGDIDRRTAAYMMGGAPVWQDGSVRPDQPGQPNPVAQMFLMSQLLCRGSEQTKICPRCHTHMPVEAVFCQTCGHRFE